MLRTILFAFLWVTIVCRPSGKVAAEPAPPTDLTTPTLNQAIAAALGYDLSQCKDPQCSAARIVMRHPAVAAAYLEVYVGQARLKHIQAIHSTLVTIRDVAIARSLA